MAGAEVELKQRKGGNAAEERAEGDMEYEENEPVLVELGDMQAVKTALDDSLVQAVSECGFPMDNFLSDIKIVLGLGSCVFGGFGQLHEWIPPPFPGAPFPKFPDDRHILGFSLAGYMLCSAILTLIAIFMEKAYVGFYKGDVNKELIFPPLKAGEDAPAWTKKVKAIQVETDLARFDVDFTVNYTIQTSDGKWHEASEETESICNWFHADGTLLEDRFQLWGKKALEKAVKGLNK